ncbi:hypothetical protein ACFC1W_12065 [Microbacterium sp. NPDC056003]|uniref:hypothetical protein n=1 Tax=Microbacterium sp. NPDC056003 TaxID=3345676 RepID=UPI0035DB72BB
MLALRSIVHRHRLPVRTLAAVLLAAAVIVGLLAMHVLSSGTADHAPAAPAAAAVSEMAPAPPSHDAAPAAGHPGTAQAGAAQAAPCDCDAPMAPMAAPDHSMLMMACVLALLVGLLLIAAPVLTGVLAVLACTTDTGLQVARRGVARARAPSLLVLSISRT